MTFSAVDCEYMARAVRLARQGLYSTDPNPRVGCVLVQGDRVVGEGFHVRAGEGHAEVNALAEAGTEAKGATAYVTLEPCSHQGKTPPCCDALIQAQVARVVCAMEDPNPLVAGKGLDRLKAAGIEVLSGVLEDDARALNPGFIKRMETRRPFVRIKLAMSLDGRTAMASGESQWITGPAARQDVQRLRARSSAVVTGIDSILLDDSSLTVRANELGLDEQQTQLATEKQPLRIVLDTHGRCPGDAKILKQPGQTWLATSESVSPIQGVEHLPLPLNDQGTLDLQALMGELVRRECNEVLVETGATLAGAFVQAELVDELVIYMAPCLLGSDARPLLNLPLASMQDKYNLTIRDMRMLDNDVRIIAAITPN